MIVRFTEKQHAESEQLGITLVHYACFYMAPLPVLEYLVHRFPKALTTLGSYRCKDCQTNLPIHIVVSSCCSIDSNEENKDEYDKEEMRTRQMELVQFLAHRYPQGLLTRNSLGLFPIHVACNTRDPNAHRHLRLVQFLVEQAPETVHMADASPSECLPLHYAIESAILTGNTNGTCNNDIVRYLVEQSPTCLMHRDASQNTPLHCAILQPQQHTQPRASNDIDGDKDKATADLVLYLARAEPRSLDSVNQDHRTPLHLVLEQERKLPLGAIQCLIDLCPEALRIPDKLGKLPLHLACESSSPASSATDLLIWKLLLERYPESITVQDSHSRLPLHLAVKANSSSLAAANIHPFTHIQYLIQAFPSATAHSDGFGECPLHKARGYNLTKILLEANPAVVEWRDKDGHTALQNALCLSWEQVMQRESFLQEWNLMTLFLWHAYFGIRKHPDPPQWHRLTEGVDRLVAHATRVEELFPWMLHAAAGTKSFPLSALSFLCRVFPARGALVYNHFHETPLLAAILTPFLQLDEVENHISKILALLDWSPSSAACKMNGRFPLAFALETRLPILPVIHRLVQCCPTASQYRDSSGFFLFQLAALGSPDIEAIYIILQMSTKTAWCCVWVAVQRFDLSLPKSRIYSSWYAHVP